MRGMGKYRWTCQHEYGEQGLIMDLLFSRFNALPAPHRLANYDEDSNGSKLDRDYNAKTYLAWDQNSELMFEKNVTWTDVRWLKENCSGLPLIVKGIMTKEDALMGLEAGADGIMVSNHGGRQLDGCLASLDVLPEVVEAVQGRIPVFLDSGVRRGTDVVKALALGATAVGIGKPVFFALSLGGEKAVVNLLQRFKAEIEAAMAICGCERIEDITRTLVSRHPSGNSLIPYIRAAL